MVFADSGLDDLMRMAEDRTAKCGALCVNQPIQNFSRPQFDLYPTTVRQSAAKDDG